MQTTKTKQIKSKPMQDNKISEEVKEPVALTLLRAGLADLKMQILSGDTEDIAAKADVSERTVIRYIKEDLVADFDTGKKILDIGRKIILKREQSLRRVA